MRLLQELFTTQVGLFAATGIAFMLGMGVFFPAALPAQRRT